MDAPAGMAVNHLMFPLAVVIFFYGLICERSWVQRFFASKPVELLGKSSYAFYLIHAGYIAEWVHGFTRINFYTFLILQAMSIAIFFFIERPLYRLIIQKDYGKDRN